MSRRLELRPLAERDLLHILDWYDAQAPGLGDEFLAALDRVFALLLRHPHLHPTIVPPARRAPLRRFPYGVVYRVSQEIIDVISVMPDKADPEKLAERLSRPA